mmetsp:Transcript_108918/g.232734  ORF Transcript_108918/g.232734 Transcript_108918/m.232734 type:complete len:261 (-) Transcript_108918:126-908(-)
MVLPLAVPLRELLNHLGGAIEGKHPISKGRICRMSCCDLFPHLVNEVEARLPIGIALPHYLHYRFVEHLRWAPQEEVHVDAQEFLCLAGSHGSSKGEALDLVSRLQLRLRLVVDEVLQSGGQDCDLVHAEATPFQALLKEVLDEGRHARLQDVCRRRTVPLPSVRTRIEALDVHAVALHKETVEHVAHPRMIQVAVLVLGHCKESRTQGLFKLGEALLRDKVSAAKRRHELVEHGCTEFLHPHLVRLRAEVAPTEGVRLP